MGFWRILRTNGFKWAIWKGVHLLRLNKLAYALSKRKRIVTVDSAAAERAYAFLNERCVDPHNSCIAQNEIAPEADIHIIVPVYNVERYLSDCLDSIVNAQKRHSWRLTVINDGSVDGSRELLQKYAEIPEVEIIDKQNGGLSSARNAGLKKIVGKYIMFIDSDDFVEYAEIEKMYDCAVADGCDVVAASYDFVDDRGKHVDTVHIVQGEGEKTAAYGFAWGKLIKAEAFKNICFPEGYWYEDALMSAVLPEFCGKVSVHDAVMYHYRVRKGSISNVSRHNEKSIDSLYIMKQLDEDRCALGIPRTAEYYEWILLMVKYTCMRVQYLKKDIRRAVFVCIADFIKNNFAGYCTRDEKFKPLEQAINDCDFGKYAAYCKWL